MSILVFINEYICSELPLSSVELLLAQGEDGGRKGGMDLWATGGINNAEEGDSVAVCRKSMASIP